MTKILVSDADARAVLARFTPGQVIPSSRMFEEYVRIARDRSQEPESRTALGRALTRAGASRRLAERWRGPRGKQRVIRTHCWIVPGALPIVEEDTRMAVVLRRLLVEDDTAFLPCTAIWEEYREMALRHGWEMSMGQNDVARWLTRQGFLRQQYNREKCRFVDRARVDRISPPAVAML